MARYIPPKVAGDVLMYRDISKGRGFWHWSLDVIAFEKHLKDSTIIYGIPTTKDLVDGFLNHRVAFAMRLSMSPSSIIKLSVTVAYPYYKSASALNKRSFSYVTDSKRDAIQHFRALQKMIMKQHNNFEGLKDVASRDIRKYFKSLGKSKGPKKTDKQRDKKPWIKRKRK